MGVGLFLQMKVYSHSEAKRRRLIFCDMHDVGGDSINRSASHPLFHSIVRQALTLCCSFSGLPPGKPRYVMGIGYPLDIVVCSALGADMCVESVPGQAGRVPVMDVGGDLLGTSYSRFRHQYCLSDHQATCRHILYYPCHRCIIRLC